MQVSETNAYALCCLQPVFPGAALQGVMPRASSQRTTATSNPAPVNNDLVQEPSLSTREEEYTEPLSYAQITAAAPIPEHTNNPLTEPLLVVHSEVDDDDSSSSPKFSGSGEWAEGVLVNGTTSISAAVFNLVTTGRCPIRWIS